MTTDDATVKDPVCGMDIVMEEARQAGLTSRYRDQEYAFCGRGCKLEFDEDPARFLAPDYVPSM